MMNRLATAWAVLGVLPIGAGIAQVGQPPAPTCSRQSHENQLPSGNTWYIQEKIVGWYEVVAPIENIVHTTKKSQWYTIDAYACTVVPCGTLEYPGPITWQQVTRERTCWGVSGSVSASAKAGLLTKLFTDLTIAVDFGGEFNKCVEKELRITVPYPQFQCFPTHLREVWTRGTHFGNVNEADEAWRWTRSNGEEILTYCNLKTASGDASDDTGRHLQKAPIACSGDPIYPDDLYDGKRALHCCDPNCDDPEICCGCTGGH